MKIADQGTLFLDEVGELPLEIQKKFLRAIQEKKFRPLGSKTEIHSNFRLICATHRDLEDLIKKEKFREDLFYRIVSLTIHLPEHIRAFNIRHRYAVRQTKPPDPETGSCPGPIPSESLPPFKDHMEKNKAEYLRHLVAVTRGDIKACCRISGLSRGHLYRLMQQYDIKNNADS